MTDLISKINSQSYSFEDIITDRCVLYLYEKADKTVVKYLHSHPIELFRYSLSQNNTAIENKAFKIIDIGNSELLTSILQSDQFLNIVLDIVNDNTLESYVLGRLSTFMLTALLKLPQISMESFGFIYHLLPHCGNHSVLHFFVTLVSDPDYSSTYKWLISMGFIEYILRELQTIDYNYTSNEENPYFDTVYIKLFSLYQILSNSASTLINPNNLASDEMISIISKKLPISPTYVENARWKTILQLTTQESSPFMVPLIQQAIMLIQNDFNRLHENLITSIDFLIQMMHYSPVYANLILKSKVLLIIMNIVQNFKNSTILLNTFKSFVEVSLNYPDLFAPTMVPLLLTFVLSNLKNRDNKIIAPFCFDILELLIDSEKKDDQITLALDCENGCREFIKGEYEEYKNIIQKNYGGLIL